MQRSLYLRSFLELRSSLLLSGEASDRFLSLLLADPFCDFRVLNNIFIGEYSPLLLAAEAPCEVPSPDFELYDEQSNICVISLPGLSAFQLKIISNNIQ